MSDHDDTALVWIRADDGRTHAVVSWAEARERIATHLTTGQTTGVEGAAERLAENILRSVFGG